MLKEKDDVVRRAMILFDGSIVSFAFFLAYFLRQHFRMLYKLDLIPSTQVVSGPLASLSEYLVVLLVVVPLWCGMLHLNGMYRSMRVRRLLEIVWIILKSSFFAILAFGTFVFLFKLAFVSRVFFAIFVMASVTFLLVEKIAFFSFMHYVRRRGLNYRSLLVVGTGRRAADFINKIQNHPEWGLKIIGAVDDEPGRGIKKVKDIKIIGTIKDISNILHRHAVDEVIFMVPRLRLNHIENAVNACETEGIKATIAVDLFDLKIARAHQTELDGIPLLTFETTVAEEWQLFIKRAMDVVLSGLGIIILSPLLLISAALIKLTSSGPVFFRQRRLGLNGRKFVLYKFRTMYEGADEDLSKVEDVSEKDRPDFRKKKVQWITPVGRILRKFSIDELPQLFNVFVGHMSFIGPRPTVPDEVSLYESWQRRRFSMKPGITCLWQIRGRNKIGFEEWMKLDLEYLDNWSLWLDFKILVKTIPVVLFGIGAY
jgi:exopolysaccharide biosynthesis polyprenyl glycosylphosphotransferase